MAKLIIPDDKPLQSVEKWLPIFDYLVKVAKAEGIPVKEMRVHSHPAGTYACWDAEADFDEMSVTFCGGQDRETVLHELAHLLVEDHHTRVWAQELFRMHRLYLPKHRVARADRAVARDYQKGMSLYKEVYGCRIPRWEPFVGWYEKRRKKK